MISNLPHNFAFSPLVTSLPTEIYFSMRCTSLTLSNNCVAPMCSSCDIPTVNNANSSMSTTQASKTGKDDAIQLNLYITSTNVRFKTSTRVLRTNTVLYFSTFPRTGFRVHLHPHNAQSSAGLTHK